MTSPKLSAKVMTRSKNSPQNFIKSAQILNLNPGIFLDPEILANILNLDKSKKWTIPLIKRYLSKKTKQTRYSSKTQGSMTYSTASPEDPQSLALLESTLQGALSPFIDTERDLNCDYPVLDFFEDEICKKNNKSVFILAAAVLKGIIPDYLISSGTNNPTTNYNTAIVEALYKPFNVNPRKKKKRFLFLYTKNGIHVNVLAATHYLKDDLLVIEETKEAFLSEKIRNDFDLNPVKIYSPENVLVGEYSTMFLSSFLEKYKKYQICFLRDKHNCYFLKTFIEEVDNLNKRTNKDKPFRIIKSNLGDITSLSAAKERFLNRKISIKDIPPFFDGDYYTESIDLLGILKGDVYTKNAYSKLIAEVCGFLLKETTKDTYLK